MTNVARNFLFFQHIVRRRARRSIFLHTSHDGSAVALFALMHETIALALTPAAAHKERAFQASSPKNFSSRALPGFFLA
jgi:hypothetical protein